MSLHHCDKCWESPCVCDDGSGYSHLSINELIRIQGAIARLITSKIKRREWERPKSK